jgi:hypothetical protein
MSLPPELRVLCLQLSTTPTVDLPRITPTLVRHVLHCQIPLSNTVGNGAKADSSASSVLVHKLKTQLSTLLNGKVPEGRFAAVILIKVVVEVGGWGVLQGTEAWVRGLLSVLGVRRSFRLATTTANSITEARSCTNKGIGYIVTYQNILYDTSVPNACSGNHDTNLTNIYHLVSEPRLCEVTIYTR